LFRDDWFGALGKLVASRLLRRARLKESFLDRAIAQVGTRPRRTLEELCDVI
jgi:hypothetical protein